MYQKNKQYLFILLSFFICTNSLFTQDPIIFTDTTKSKLLIADVRISPSAPEINLNKVEAALNLSAELSEKFTLIPEKLKDSITNEHILKGEQIDVLKIAKFLYADKILFILINRLANIIRADITIVNTKDTSEKRNGVGYSLIHFFDNQTNTPLSDPFLLEAIQRALMNALGDSSLYDHLPENLKVFPAPTIIIGGIEFIDNNSLPDMLLFKNKVIVSYDLCESIFEELSQNHNFVPYDIATRDSMYALANFHIVENYNPPSLIELKILSLFEVEYYITGSYKRIPEGASLEIQLCKIENQMLRIVNSVNAIHKNDDISELRNLAKQLTKKLINFTKQH